MPEIQSKATGQTFPVSDKTWAQYGTQDLQKNFRVTKKDVSPPEVEAEKATPSSPKRLAGTPRTSGAEGGE